MSRRFTFQTRIEYAECINTLVEVEGNAEEGVTSVYAVGVGHVGEEITESISLRAQESLHAELMEWIAEEAGDAADRAYDEMRDRKYFGT